MSDEFEFEEILNDGLLGGQMEPIRFKNPDLNRHMDKLLEVHAEPGEMIFWINDERLKFKPAKPMVHRRIYGIGDDPRMSEPDPNIIDTDTELAELRAWMVKNIRGLQPQRSTASYALEFLRTQQRNLSLLHARMRLQIMMSDCRKIAERMPEAAATCLDLERDQSVIPWTNGDSE